jgi:hypothetical protein
MTFALMVQEVPLTGIFAPETGCYIMPFDVARHDGRAPFPVTTNIAEAAHFGTVAEAVTFLTTQSQVVPTRPDGGPNRPLTALTIELVRAGSDGITARFWTSEVTGQLRPAVEAYLTAAPMTPRQVAVIRAYLRQWMAPDSWRGPLIDPLRTKLEEITTREDINRWVKLAEQANIDPF